MTFSRRILAAAAAVAVSLVCAASAAASSIVYVSAGNVWLANPDGSGRYQVTLDGTPSDPYFSPSQADDGTIVAVRGSSPARLYRMSQNGTLLGAPFATASPLGNVLDAEVSPDGSKVAYSFVTVTNGCFPYGCASADVTVDYTYADHFGDPGGGLQRDWRWVSWASNGRTLLTNDSNIAYYDDVGGGDDSNVEWFDQCQAGLADCSQSDGPGIHALRVSRDGHKAAWIWQFPDPDPQQVADDPYLQLGTTGGDVASGAPPQAPTTPACYIGPGPKEPAGQPAWDRPTFAPDGSSVAWAEGDGIHVAPASLGDCNAMVAGDHLVIAGGSQPSWGPAPVAPAPRPAAGGGGGGTTGGGAAAPPNPAKIARLSQQRLAGLLTRGLRVRARCTRSCRLAGRLTAARATARRLHLRARRGTATLGTGRLRIRAHGSRTLTVRLSRPARTALRHAHPRPFTLTLTVKVSDATGHAWTVRRHVKVRR